MINIVGIEYLKANIENDEYSYPKAYKERGLEFNPITRGGRKYEKLDIRFVKDNVSVLIETKKDFISTRASWRDLAIRLFQLSPFCLFSYWFYMGVIRYIITGRFIEGHI